MGAASHLLYTRRAGLRSNGFAALLQGKDFRLNGIEPHVQLPEFDSPALHQRPTVFQNQRKVIRATRSREKARRCSGGSLCNASVNGARHRQSRPLVLMQFCNYTKAMVFGKDLQKARQACQLSVGQVARSIGKDRTTIWRWENGVTSPTLDDLSALLKAFPAIAFTPLRITRGLHICSLETCPGYVPDQRAHELN